MTPEEFRQRRIRSRPDCRLPTKHRTTRRAAHYPTWRDQTALPASPPDTADPFEQIMGDVEKLIMPGLLHWQHPSFFGFFPSMWNCPQCSAIA